MLVLWSFRIIVLSSLSLPQKQALCGKFLLRSLSLYLPLHIKAPELQAGTRNECFCSRYVFISEGSNTGPNTKGKANLRREEENKKIDAPGFCISISTITDVRGWPQNRPESHLTLLPAGCLALKTTWVLWVSFIVRCYAWSENLPSCLPQVNLDKYVWLGPAFRVESKQSQQRRNTRAILIFYQTEAWPESTRGPHLSVCFTG